MTEERKTRHKNKHEAERAGLDWMDLNATPVNGASFHTYPVNPELPNGEYELVTKHYGND